MSVLLEIEIPCILLFLNQNRNSQNSPKRMHPSSDIFFRNSQFFPFVILQEHCVCELMYKAVMSMISAHINLTTAKSPWQCLFTEPGFVQLDPQWVLAGVVLSLPPFLSPSLQTPANKSNSSTHPFVAGCFRGTTNRSTLWTVPLLSI